MFVGLLFIISFGLCRWYISLFSLFECTRNRKTECIFNILRRVQRFGLHFAMRVAHLLIFIVIIIGRYHQRHRILCQSNSSKSVEPMRFWNYQRIANRRNAFRKQTTRAHTLRSMVSRQCTGAHHIKYENILLRCSLAARSTIGIWIGRKKKTQMIFLYWSILNCFCSAQAPPITAHVID